eukprot:m.27356 g.27356  ORF g.27356 m.27356 type:complete len:952 (+) comp29933_c1_seq4:49-2904(+)
MIKQIQLKMTVGKPPNSWHMLLTIFVLVAAAQTASQSCPVDCTCRDHTVDCSGLGLFRLPPNLPPDTRVLDLTGNAIDLMPDAFGGLPGLVELSLARNNLTHIPTFTAKNSLLKKLTLSGNKITTISGAAISALWRLKTLDLKRNLIEELRGASFPKNSSLQSLLLNGNKIKMIYDSFFHHLTELKYLRLAQNLISVWNVSFSIPLKKLEILDLGGNQFSLLPPMVFGGLLKLRLLILKRNKISGIENGAFNLAHKMQREHSLEELHLQFNQLTEINPGALFGLEVVKKINFSHNRINSIDLLTFKQFSALEELDLSVNQIPLLHQNVFADLTSLTFLSLASNNIEGVNDGSFIGLTKLLTLDLSHNEIFWDSHVTTAFFSQTPSLISLNLAHNRIIFIHRKCFSGLTYLRTLNLAHNSVSMIAEGAFSSLVALKEMHLNSSYFLCDCELAWFPVWIVQKRVSVDVDGVCISGRRTGTNIKDVRQEDFNCDGYPVITQHPRKTSAIFNETTVLSCIASSPDIESLQFTWIKDQSVVSANDRVGIVSEGGASQLTIFKTEMQDKGNYSCRVRNVIGYKLSKTAPVTVSIKPVFTVKPSDSGVEESSTASFECSASGFPKPVIKVKMPSKMTIFKRKFTMKKGMAVINKFAKEDEGIYACVASNAVGTITVNFTLTVLPKVHASDLEMNVPTGKSLIMKCSDKFLGTKTWLKGGKPVVSKNRWRLTEQSDWLVFESLHQRDSGIYECKVKSEKEVIIETIRLTVEQQENETKGLTDDQDEAMFHVWIAVSVVCGMLFATALWTIVFISLRWKGDHRRRILRTSGKQGQDKGNNATAVQLKAVVPRANEKTTTSISAPVFDAVEGSSGSGRVPIQVYVQTDDEVGRANGGIRESSAASDDDTMSFTSSVDLATNDRGAELNRDLVANGKGKDSSRTLTPMVIVGPDGSFRAVSK